MLNLITSSSKDHIMEKKKSNSMTELHKLTSNPPVDS